MGSSILLSRKMLSRTQSIYFSLLVCVRVGDFQNLLDRVSELAEQEQSWSQAADTFMAVDLEHLVSVRSRASYRDALLGMTEKRIKKLRFAPGARCSPGSNQGITATGVSIRLLSELGDLRSYGRACGLV